MFVNIIKKRLQLLWNPQYNGAPDTRGKAIIDFIVENQFTILNDGRFTRISNTFGHSSSAIDLALIDTQISNLFTWDVSSEPYGSDHLPTFLNLLTEESVVQSRIKWNINGVD